MFTAIHPFPGIMHITDIMGVSFTLIEGSESAILFDTGYGIEDVYSYIRTLTDKPFKVVLSHGHHDHMLGARWFHETFMSEDDKEEFIERTGTLQRLKVKKQAEEKHVDVPETFMNAEIPLPVKIRFDEKAGMFEGRTERLGNLDIRLIHVPGHTPGSVVLFIPDYELLLTGDNWNPCTWMWFPSSVSAFVWRENMKSVIRWLEKEYNCSAGNVLCSHQPMIRQGSEMKSFLEFMTDERMKSAPSINMGVPINTHIIRNEAHDWTLLFDKDKLKQ